MKHKQQESVKQLRQIEGRNPVLEALRASTQVQKIALEAGIRSDERIEEILELAGKQGVEIERTFRKLLLKRSKTQAHQGVIAWAQWPEEPTIRQVLYEAERRQVEPFFLLVPKLTYEQNLGAILRTAEAAGVNAVVIGNRSLGLSPVVSRVSMGASEHVPLIHDNIFSAIRTLKQAGLRIVASQMDGKVSVFDAPLSGPVAVVMGDEHKGISESLADRIDLTVRIPMLGKINSLNVSVATGVLLYEVVRQRQQSQ
jgi:23S rRNA (guanosine2251-2'-O)-methyltransferase